MEGEQEIKIIKRCIAVTGFFMLAEIVVGYQFNVLSLVADSYHMMNDLASFILQLYARQLGGVKRESAAFSFGFSRVESLANLMQATLLVALCLTLALESLQRLYSPETITMPPLVVGLGALALMWNLYVWWKFEKDEHEHEHEHGTSAQSIAHPVRYRRMLSLSVHHASQAQQQSVKAEKAEFSLRRFLSAPKNGLALHAFGDAMGNIAVIFDGVATLFFGPKIGKTSGLFASWDGIPYIDPLCSLVVVYVVFTHAMPLMTGSSFGLMQAFDPVKAGDYKKVLSGSDWLPRDVAPHIRTNLLDLHIWSLNPRTAFATIRLEVQPTSKDGGLVELPELEAIRVAAKRVHAHSVPPSQVVVEIVDSATR
ncbi:hypothetical protein JCM10908_002349 [Rhodotorula pacifica]|uniref:uncharacterized protein n=1 Tax=Rhodotorula pacifica TaxID=1495444 RepID=UPI003170CD12